ncbi:hypothetical protein SFC55_26090 [Niallia taxi]|uniref:hypothetical protein n=1 Tax=Niallia taxi TaxID=2499688 RepID=UPI0039828CA8
MDVKEIFQIVALGVGALTGVVTTIKNISDMKDKRKKALEEKRLSERNSEDSQR